MADLVTEIAKRLGGADMDSILSEALHFHLSHPEQMPQDVYLKLQALAESMGMDVAQGQDEVDGFREIFDEVARLQDLSPWTMHPDYGCVRADAVAALDAAAQAQQPRFHVLMKNSRGLTVAGERLDDPVEAMKAFVTLRRSGFGDEHGKGSYVALVDRLLKFDASYEFEGRGVYREQFGKDAGRELHAEVQAITKPRFTIEVAESSQPLDPVIRFQTGSSREAMKFYVLESTSRAANAQVGAGAVITLQDERGEYGMSVELENGWSVGNDSAHGPKADRLFVEMSEKFERPLQVQQSTLAALLLSDGAAFAQSARDSGRPLEAAAADLKALLPVSSDHDFWKWYGVPEDQSAVEAEIRSASNLLMTGALERMVEDNAATIMYERLDWAVAMALGFQRAGAGGEPVWDVDGSKYGISGAYEGSRPVFDPSSNTSLSVRFMDLEGVGARKVGEGHWRASYSDGSNEVDGPDMCIAGLRCIVMKNIGRVVEVPVVFKKIPAINEPMSDAVIAERVAAHYTDYFQGPVNCSKNDEFDKNPSGFNIGASGLPVHHGNPQYPKTWSMGDELSHAKAEKIAQDYPAVKAERDRRIEALLGPMRISQNVDPKLQAVQNLLRDMEGSFRRNTGVQSPDLGHWAYIEWEAARTMVRWASETPESVAQAIALASPSAVLHAERENLQTHLVTHVARIAEIKAELVAGPGLSPA